MSWISPEMLTTLIQVRDWVAPAAVALVCFFLVRYITKRDTFETNIEKKFEAHTEQFALKLTNHATEVARASDKFENAVLEVKGVAVNMQQSTLEFQAAVNEKLIDIEKRSIGIEGTLERTAEKANHLETKVDETLEKVGKMAEMVQFHDRAVGELAKNFMENRHKIEENRAEITQLKRKTKKH